MVPDLPLDPHIQEIVQMGEHMKPSLAYGYLHEVAAAQFEWTAADWPASRMIARRSLFSEVKPYDEVIV